MIRMKSKNFVNNGSEFREGGRRVKSWEIEKMLKEDIREKKKTGSGAFHMRGKGVRHGFSGALRTPFHFMKTKEKNKLSGEVTVHNMFTTILNWSEFQLKDRETQKMLLTKWRETFSNVQIQEQLQVGRDKAFNTQSFADLVNDLGCPPKRKGGSQPKSRGKYKPRQAVATIQPTEEKQVELALPPSQLELAIEEPKITIFNGLNLEYNGEYNCDELTKIFTKLQLLVDGEPNKYKISLALVEMG
jgi:hypothetical protein